jgi:hypothetical protein
MHVTAKSDQSIDRSVLVRPHPRAIDHPCHLECMYSSLTRTGVLAGGSSIGWCVSGTRLSSFTSSLEIAGAARCMVICEPLSASLAD